MKERCTLLRVGFAFCSCLKKNLTGPKNHTFWLCFYKKGSESLFLKRRRERIALVALLKRATRTICSCCSFKKSNASESFSSLFTKRAKRGICSFFCQKTRDSQEKPKSKFSTLSGNFWHVFFVYLCHLTPLFKCFSIFTYDFDFGGGFRINR